MFILCQGDNYRVMNFGCFFLMPRVVAIHGGRESWAARLAMADHSEEAGSRDRFVHDAWGREAKATSSFNRHGGTTALGPRELPE